MWPRNVYLSDFGVQMDECWDRQTDTPTERHTFMKIDKIIEHASNNEMLLS